LVKYNGNYYSSRGNLRHGSVKMDSPTIRNN